MNSVTARSSNRANQARNNNNRPSQSVETAGSLAMLNAQGWLSSNMHDSFISSNPFAIDYSQYANVSNNDGSSTSYSSFYGSFSNASSTMGSSDGGSGYSGASCGASSGASSGGCGGFTSVC